jgi:hypothetical protein
MTTSTPQSLPRHRRPSGWRIALLLSGAASLVGGSLHPDADADDPLREELATMTADPNWVPGHALLLLGTVLLVAGLWTAYRQQVWPAATDRVLLVATCAFGLYAVESVFHLAAVVDSEALHAGHSAPIAYTHVWLAFFLYPVSGIALVVLAASLGRALGGPAWVVAVVGVIGGLAHAVSVPLSLMLPDAELTPVFAGAGVLLAAWSLGTGLVGARSRGGRPAEDPVPVG